ncbi:MAG TPA: hypothetical protein VKM55_21750 [Candidatus Lokiarchaeia archaeon]|nr:hypothetical protein [Candidatus Lokiarchaeia archaeon]
MKEIRSPLVKEGWTGPGNKDGVITPTVLTDDALHIDVGKKNQYEWWYFDARLESGHTLVAFFYAANPNPGPTAGKIGVELVLVRPDGLKTQIFIPYKKTEFSASREQADVKIGKNFLVIDNSKGDLPVYIIHVDEAKLGFDLTYTAAVNGWKPGTGLSEFGNLGYFAWVVPFVRASVQGTVRDGDQQLDVMGVGYHDHNWLNFSFQSIIDYWMWGRVYSENYSMSYAFIQCNKKVDNHAVKVLMLAKGKDVILSTGEFEFLKKDFEFNGRAKHSFPREITIRVPGEMEATLRVEKILEAEDMLDRFPKILQFLAKNLLRLKPGYFRLQSTFDLEVQENGNQLKESGSTLHEIVLFKTAESQD